jgi:hypothetical protein
MRVLGHKNGGPSNIALMPEVQRVQRHVVHMVTPRYCHPLDAWPFFRIKVSCVAFLHVCVNTKIDYAWSLITKLNGVTTPIRPDEGRE